MHWTQLDWDAIKAHVDTNLLPSHKEQMKLVLKEAFAKGTIIAGVHRVMEEPGSEIGCALGQFDIASFNHGLHFRAMAVIATVNNLACTRDGDIDDGFFVNGIPCDGGGTRPMEHLVTIEPLLELIDRCF